MSIVFGLHQEITLTCMSCLNKREDLPHLLEPKAFWFVLTLNILLLQVWHPGVFLFRTVYPGPCGDVSFLLLFGVAFPKEDAE